MPFVTSGGGSSTLSEVLPRRQDSPTLSGWPRRHPSLASPTSSRSRASLTDQVGQVRGFFDRFLDAPGALLCLLHRQPGLVEHPVLHPPLRTQTHRVGVDAPIGIGALVERG